MHFVFYEKNPTSIRYRNKLPFWFYKDKFWPGWNQWMRKRDAFETLACSLGTVEPTERGDCPPMAVLSKNWANIWSVLLSSFEEWCGRHSTLKLGGFFSSKTARNDFISLQFCMLTWNKRFFSLFICLCLICYRHLTPATNHCKVILSWNGGKH